MVGVIWSLLFLVLIVAFVQDEPRPQTSRRSFARGMPLPRFLNSRSPIVEGYTLITLDVGERPSSVSQIDQSLYIHLNILILFCFISRCLHC